MTAEEMPLPIDLQPTSPNGAPLVAWIAVYGEGYWRMHGDSRKLHSGYFDHVRVTQQEEARRGSRG